MGTRFAIILPAALAGAALAASALGTAALASPGPEAACPPPNKLPPAAGTRDTAGAPEPRPVYHPLVLRGGPERPEPRPAYRTRGRCPVLLPFTAPDPRFQVGAPNAPSWFAFPARAR
ncbi:hypothetical protein BTM25_19660 [Actinomadura rubteroloni]|uniref:Uncharacterized protein n=1 Tax=Actinomadura rubteroloni TaxID=1926885 RepID=A0A2P4UR75_9ACTN|nr:hypothetical protein [Actinomadura rubteroloni]POM27550.1 hypothetical protein BTM25_19660 [Actinomadura rubteroloni]